MYTSGIWTVKDGREDEFARRWQESATASRSSSPTSRSRSYATTRTRRRFVSLGEGWRNLEQIEPPKLCPRFRTRWRRSGACAARRRCSLARVCLGPARGLDERERDLDHRIQVVHGDVLVGRVDLHHPVREVHAREATGVEDVRVRAAARSAHRSARSRPRAARSPRAPPADRSRGTGSRGSSGAPRSRPRIRRGSPRTPRSPASRARARPPCARRASAPRPLNEHHSGTTLRAVPPADDADVRARLLVDPPEPEVGDRPRCRRDGRAAVLGKHARMRRASMEAEVEQSDACGEPSTISPIGAPWS